MAVVLWVARLIPGSTSITNQTIVFFQRGQFLCHPTAWNQTSPSVLASYSFNLAQKTSYKNSLNSPFSHQRSWTSTFRRWASSSRRRRCFATTASTTSTKKSRWSSNEAERSFRNLAKMEEEEMKQVGGNLDKSLAQRLWHSSSTRGCGFESCRVQAIFHSLSS